jgi:23S rRNA pseudouridine2605 synthase
MFEEVGHHVEKIRRVQYGPLALDMPPGDWRNLTLLEVAKLKTAATGPKLTLPPPPAAAAERAKFAVPAKVLRSAKQFRPSRSSHNARPAKVSAQRAGANPGHTARKSPRRGVPKR